MCNILFTLGFHLFFMYWLIFKSLILLCEKVNSERYPRYILREHISFLFVDTFIVFPFEWIYVSSYFLLRCSVHGQAQRFYFAYISVRTESTFCELRSWTVKIWKTFLIANINSRRMILNHPRIGAVSKFDFDVR